MRISWSERLGTDALPYGGANSDATKVQERTRTCKTFDMTHDDAPEAVDEFCPEVLQITVPRTALLSTGGKEGARPTSDPVAKGPDGNSRHATKLQESSRRCRVRQAVATKRRAYETWQPRAERAEAAAGAIWAPHGS